MLSRLLVETELPSIASKPFFELLLNKFVKASILEVRLFMKLSSVKRLELMSFKLFSRQTNPWAQKQLGLLYYKISMGILHFIC
jgi:hypothetical protein